MTDDDNVLLHLRRTYAKDEMISYIAKRMRELKIELGQANSEIDHLNSLLQDKEGDKEAYKAAKVEIKKEQLWKEQRELVTTLEKTVRKLRVDNSELITKLLGDDSRNRV